ncbi:hypothetical protein Mal64_06950 [Pseudobythopirellula maris]|uniref:PEP-CTERM protein-sorting domain-containing protein n=1 Tax=Pseudobythopirellula maris TaxID=2527991 RepID=A0A5C5ZST1_9BACT|nr:hypothetical protein [Pseudobythopirellula maris]TWT90310.1 hypothetical protein Mal64_06950 [Pseudobythopirellula maris]
MKRILNTHLTAGAAALAALLCLAQAAQAAILDDFNAGELIADFQFDDADGTALDAAANSVDPLALFDNDSDNDNVVTNGLGQLDASGKDNTAFGSNYVDIGAISYGRAIGLFDVSWDFDESVYDGAQDEEFRLTLVQFDPRSTFVTGETFFTRTSATEVTLTGNAVGTGSVDTSDAVFGSTGDMLTLIDVNLDESTLDLWYSIDDGVSFTLLGGGVLDPNRGIESLRVVLNEDFSNDTLLIERVALSFIVPEPTSAAIACMALTALIGRRQRD